MREINYKITKSFTGKIRVKYGCPKCGTILENEIAEAGHEDFCPDCNTRFIVPGVEERRSNERKEARKLEAKKQKAKEAALEKIRLAELREADAQQRRAEAAEAQAKAIEQETEMRNRMAERNRQAHAQGMIICSSCHTPMHPVVQRSLSSVGILVFVLGLLFCLIGALFCLLFFENVSVCPNCGAKRRI